MSIRNDVKTAMLRYMNTHNLKFATVKDITREIKGELPKTIDVYRNVYGIGLNDPGFSVERDEHDTYVVMG